ncbi:MAG: twin-arginine translocation signal domain-containing protein, partial [Betaproteobacteria bacterium]
MITRRTFLKFSSAGALTLYTLNEFGVEEAIAAIPGGTLSPRAIPKFVTPLVKPPAMPTSGLNAYSIAVRQFTQQILPPPLPATTVWSYGSPTEPATFNYPAFTIEATRGTPITVTWVNDLKDGGGNFLPHLLPVDPTLHWANPPNGTNPPVNGVGTRDSRPKFATTPGRSTGRVPIVTHVHGMEGLEDWSDGYAEAWYLPAASNIPAGFATAGTWYNFFKGKAASAGVPAWSAGQAIFRYPNTQRP